MTAKNLSTIANEIIDHNGKTAINVLTSYRVGGERLISFVDQRWASAVKTGGARLSKQVRSNLIDGQQRVSGFYVKGLAVGTDRAESLVSSAVELATKGVDSFAANAVRFEHNDNLGTIEMFTRATLPAAKALSQVAERLEQGSSQLVKRVAGKPAANAKRRAAAKNAVAGTRTVRKSAVNASAAARSTATLRP